MTTETPNDHLETLGYDAIAKRLDHMDERLHDVMRKLDNILAHVDDVTAFIDQHKPALTRGLGMLDAGSKMRGFLGAKHGKDQHGQAAT